MTTLTDIARQDNAERDAAIQRAERAEAAWGRFALMYRRMRVMMESVGPEPNALHDLRAAEYYDALDVLTESDLSGPPAPGATTTPPVRIVRLKKTCQRRPAQWEGRLSDGRDFYARYRWGNFSAHAPNGFLDGGGWDDDDLIIETQDDDTDAGDMTTAEMLARLPDWLTAAPGLSVDGDAG